MMTYVFFPPFQMSKLRHLCGISGDWHDNKVKPDTNYTNKIKDQHGVWIKLTIRH